MNLNAKTKLILISSSSFSSDLESWLQLYGYEVSKMLGAQYIERQVYQPSARVTSQQLAPDFGVMSGLQCIVEKVRDLTSFFNTSSNPLSMLFSGPLNLRTSNMIHILVKK